MNKINLLLVVILVFACSKAQKQNQGNQVSSNQDTVALNSHDLSDNIDFNKFARVGAGHPSEVKFSSQDKIYIFPKPEIIYIKDDSLSESKLYWALFQHENGFFYMRKIKAKKEMYELPIGSSAYKFYSSINKAPIYIFDGIDYNEQFIFKVEHPQCYPLRPGDVFYFNSLKETTGIYVTGSVEKAENSVIGKPFGRAIDYSIYILTKTEDKQSERVLFHSDTLIIDGNRFEPSIGVDLIGDLDLDGKTDFILTFSNHYASLEYRLYLSSKGELKSIENFSALYKYSD